MSNMKSRQEQYKERYGVYPHEGVALAKVKPPTLNVSQFQL